MKYEHMLEGFNSRLDTIQAAILRVKLRYLERWTEQRLVNVMYYRENLLNVPQVKLPEAAEDRQHVYHQFVIQVPNRDELQSMLKDKGISTGIHYPLPLHLQPAYSYLKHSAGDFPAAEKAAQQILSLPIDAEISAEEIKYITDSIQSYFTA